MSKKLKLLEKVTTGDQRMDAEDEIGEQMHNRDRLRIRNISGETSPLDLVDLFSKKFEVLNVTIHLHGNNASDLAEAYVTMYKDDARKAKEWANGRYWFDQKLKADLEEDIKRFLG